MTLLMLNQIGALNKQKIAVTDNSRNTWGFQKYRTPAHNFIPELSFLLVSVKEVQKNNANLETMSFPTFFNAQDEGNGYDNGNKSCNEKDHLDAHCKDERTRLRFSTLPCRTQLKF